MASLLVQCLNVDDDLNEPVAYRLRWYNALLDANVVGRLTEKQIQKKLDNEYKGKQPLRKPSKFRRANLVSSLCVDGKHRPALDIDVPCELIPSSTEGHAHLYFPTVSLSWEQYQKLLTVLAECKIIEKGFSDMSIKSGQSLLRLPGVKKFPLKRT